jgi:hypothetical protein
LRGEQRTKLTGKENTDEAFHGEEVDAPSVAHDPIRAIQNPAPSAEPLDGTISAPAADTSFYFLEHQNRRSHRT